MSKFIRIALISFFLMGAMVHAEEETWYVLNDGTVARSGPDPTSLTLFNLNKGVQVRKGERKGDWQEVLSENKSGWVFWELVGPSKAFDLRNQLDGMTSQLENIQRVWSYFKKVDGSSRKGKAASYRMCRQHETAEKVVSGMNDLEKEVRSFFVGHTPLWWKLPDPVAVHLAEMKKSCEKRPPVVAAKEAREQSRATGDDPAGARYGPPPEPPVPLTPKNEVDAVKKTSAAREGGNTLYVHVDVANVRSGPDLKAPVLFKLSKGSQVMKGKTKGNWVEIFTEDRKGWIYVKLVGPSEKGGQGNE